MSNQPVAGTEVRLGAADACELAELLVFLRDWLTGSQDSETLAASLARFPGSAGADTPAAVQVALTRFASLLTPASGEVDF